MGAPPNIAFILDIRTMQCVQLAYNVSPCPQIFSSGLQDFFRWYCGDIGPYNWTRGAGIAPFVSPYMGPVGSLFHGSAVPMIVPRVVMGLHGSHCDVIGSNHYSGPCMSQIWDMPWTGQNNVIT